MPGMLTTLFDAGDDDASSEQNTSSQNYDAGAHGGIDLSPSVGVSHHAETSWEDPNGTTHDYSSDTDVVLTADASAAFAVAGSLTQSGNDEG